MNGREGRDGEGVEAMLWAAGGHICGFDRGGELHGYVWSRRCEGKHLLACAFELIDGPRHARHRARRPWTASPAANHRGA